MLYPRLYSYKCIDQTHAINNIGSFLLILVNIFTNIINMIIYEYIIGVKFEIPNLNDNILGTRDLGRTFILFIKLDI